MENKVESPDYQMDISEAGTITTDNISTSSASPTISNQAEIETSNGIDTIAETVTKNMNSIPSSIQLSTSGFKNHDLENMENRNNLTLDTRHPQQKAQKLTPVHHHPLMIDDDENESEDSCNSSNISNFPDVVIAHHQPLRLAQPAAKHHATADLVNSVNNNNAAKSRKPIYREPSPVSRNDFLFNALNLL